MTNPHLHNARTFARLMDSQFSIFRLRFGIDNILGLIPGLGDIASMFLSLYLVWVGIQMKLPFSKLLQMILNLGFDAAIGTVPFIGDIADFFYKANTKNLEILEQFDLR
ncbi:MAG: hypothetical protein QG570_255 [Patescibacteria group bacterium]|nr:hypothetical protein [Patescibacteria group bacterium]